MTTAEHSSYIRGTLEDFSAAPKSQRLSSASSINHCRRLREGLETQLEFTNSTLFVSGPDILNITLAAAELLETSCILWRGHCRHLGIMDSTPTTYNLYKYIWKVILCMVLIDERRLGPDIWPEITNQTKSIEDMMRVVWAKEAHCR